MDPPLLSMTVRWACTRWRSGSQVRWQVAVVIAMALTSATASLLLLSANPWRVGLIVGMFGVCAVSLLGCVDLSFHAFGQDRAPYPRHLWARSAMTVAPFVFGFGFVGFVWQVSSSDLGVDASWLPPMLGVAGLVATPFLASLLWGLLVDVPRERASRAGSSA